MAAGGKTKPSPDGLLRCTAASGMDDADPTVLGSATIGPRQTRSPPADKGCDDHASATEVVRPFSDAPPRLALPKVFPYLTQANHTHIQADDPRRRPPLRARCASLICNGRRKELQRHECRAGARLDADGIKTNYVNGIG